MMRKDRMGMTKISSRQGKGRTDYTQLYFFLGISFFLSVLSASIRRGREEGLLLIIKTNKLLLLN
jgi:hypothetical protein